LANHYFVEEQPHHQGRCQWAPGFAAEGVLLTDPEYFVPTQRNQIQAVPESVHRPEWDFHHFLGALYQHLYGWV